MPDTAAATAATEAAEAATEVAEAATEVAEAAAAAAAAEVVEAAGGGGSSLADGAIELDRHDAAQPNGLMCYIGMSSEHFWFLWQVPGPEAQQPASQRPAESRSNSPHLQFAYPAGVWMGPILHGSANRAITSQLC